MNKPKNNSKPLIWFMGLLLTAFIAGCGSGGDGGGASTAQPGTVSVSMTDSPACGFDKVNITVSKVRVHQSSSADDKAAGWTDITLDPPRTINLLDLNDPTQAPKFALESLGETPLPAGHYTQLRLVLVENNGNQPSANWIVLSSTKTVKPLDTPSAMQSGIKLIHQFTVDSGQRVDLLLDFDACKSIVHTGSDKYKLKPVIKVIPSVLNGIEGFIDTALLGSNVVVSAQVNGEIVRATVPNTTSNDPALRGKFFLTRLTPGGHDVVITADAHATAVIAGVPVPSSTSITTISTSASTGGTPFTLQPSAFHAIAGTVTLTPPIPTDETVSVAAKQTFGSVPPLTLVTVKSQVADPEVDPQNNPTGNYRYALTLPIEAPSFGQYNTQLPIILTAQSAVAKKYTIEASATGYQTKSLDIPDISVVNAPQDFTLTP